MSYCSSSLLYYILIRYPPRRWQWHPPQTDVEAGTNSNAMTEKKSVCSLIFAVAYFLTKKILYCAPVNQSRPPSPFFFQIKHATTKKRRNHDLWSCSCIILCRICLLGRSCFAEARRFRSWWTNEKKKFYMYELAVNRPPLYFVVFRIMLLETNPCGLRYCSVK